MKTTPRLPKLQQEGARSFDQSWNELMDSIASKRATIERTSPTGGKR
jgi:hypothetical protein